jgi:hypothetical protein
MVNRVGPIRRWIGAWIGAAIAVTTIGDLAWGITIGAPQQIGTIISSALKEVSGLVDSRANANTFWVHNDSGDPAQFFAIDHTGTLLGTFPLANAPTGDWEDIAIGPKPAGGNYLYLGDVGDNNGLRTFVTVYRTDEPQSTTGATIPTGDYASVKLQYPGGPRDVESIFVDPLSGDMFFITKRTAIPEIYSVSTVVFDNPGQTVTMTPLGNLQQNYREEVGHDPNFLLSTPTAADVSPDGRFVLVRSRVSSTGYVFERATGQSVADALHGAGVPFTLGAETQGEAIGWAADGASFFTTSEWDNLTSAPISTYSFTAQAPLLAGDYNNDGRVDAADYTVWRNQMGANVALPNEDATPGVVTADDYDVWRAHFGESAGGGGAAEGVPEPETMTLAALAALMFGFVARRVG